VGAGRDQHLSILAGLCVRPLQVAHFLRAPTRAWAAAFWAAVQPGRPDDADSAGLALVAAARPAIATAICDGHPEVLDAHQSFLSKLRSAPAIVHAAVAHSCVQHLPAGPRLVIHFSNKHALLSNGSTLALVQCAFSAVQALQQQPAVTLQIGGAEGKEFATALAAAEQYAGLPGGFVVSICLGCTPGAMEEFMSARGQAAMPRSRVCGLWQRLSSGAQSLQILPIDYHSNVELAGQGVVSSIRFSELAPSLAVLTRLRWLSIASCKIHDGGTSICAAALRNLTALEELVLQRNNFAGESGAIFRALGQLPHFSALLLFDNSYYSNPAWEQLQTIVALTQLEWRGYHAEFGMLAGVTALRQLSVSNVELDDAAAQRRISTFSSLSCLERLQLVEKYCHGAVYAGALSKLPAPELLTHLRFDVAVGKASATTCLGQLPRFSCLKELELSFSVLFEPQEAWLALPVGGLASGFQSLCIKQGQIGHAGAQLLAAALARLTKLTRLQLPGT
jgi:hypothetical protein